MKDDGTHVADVRWEGVLEDNDGYARLLEIYATHESVEFNDSFINLDRPGSVYIHLLTVTPCDNTDGPPRVNVFAEFRKVR